MLIELTKRMLGLMLEFRVWSECRPRHENEVHGVKLLADLDVIENREIEQGQSTFLPGPLPAILGFYLSWSSPSQH